MDATNESVASRASVAALLFWAVVCGLSNPMSVEANDNDGTSPSVATVEEIVDVWQQRETRAERFHAEWIHERTYTKFWADCHVPFARAEYVTLPFARSSLTVDGDRLRFDSGAVESGGDAVRFEIEPAYDRFGRGAHDDARRVFRDDRIRYDAGHPRVDPREPVPTAWPRNLRPFSTVFDGRRSLQFLPADRGCEPEAYRFADAQNQFRTSLHLLPLVLTVRPSWLGLSPATCRLERSRESLQGRNCCVLIDDVGMRREFWLDTDRDFVVLSYREDCDVLGARMQNRIDITYSEDDDGRRRPSAWTTVFFDNHGLMEQSAPATVLSATTDPSIDDTTFEVRFPAGTWVFDEETGRHHIVGADGRTQPITANELREGLSHAELIARGTWSGRMSGTAKAAWRQSWLRFATFLTIFGGAAWWLPRRRGREPG